MSDAPNGGNERAPGPESEPGRESSLFFRRRASLRSPKQALQPEAPPPPPPRAKRKEGTLSALSGFLSVLLVFAVGGAFGLIAAAHKLQEPGPLPADKLVNIAPRADVPEILSQLEREGVIDSPLLMNVALLVERARGLFVERARSRLEPGEYLFKQHVSLRDVMDMLVNGRVVNYAVTIPEGLTSEQVVQRLRDNDVLAGEVKEIPKEGALLPETYKVWRGYLRSKLLAKMQEDQRKLLEKIWARRSSDLPIKTSFELVTLASIVEKETGLAGERPRVAGVFVNRLRKGMRLQSDPTIVYGIVGGKATLGRGILRSEIEKWTPYNTYAVDGLPPGPIANPGRAALEAAANPLRTQDLYFVADGTGGHVFAETLEQHFRNVQRWRQIEKDMNAKGTADVDRVPPTYLVPPAQPGRDQRGDAGETAIGRLVAIDDGREDRPAGRRAFPDSRGKERIGEFSPSAASAYAGENEYLTWTEISATNVERRATPFFTRAFARALAQSKRAVSPVGDSAAYANPEARSRSRADGVSADNADGANDGVEIEAKSGLEPSAYPALAKLRAERKPRASGRGLPSGSDESPPVVETVAAAPEPRARSRALDASEGTALDPLRDKSWDLSTAKSVPASVGFR